MKKLILAAFILLISGDLFPQSRKLVGGHEYTLNRDGWYKNHKGNQYKVDTDIITIKLKTSEIHSLTTRYDLSIVRESKNGYYDMRIRKGSSVLETVERLLNESDIVESIDVNTYGEYVFNPNDTEFSNQWYLNKIGMVSVWNTVKSNDCIQIAIIDSGLDISHEDIGRGVDSYDNLWRNLGEDAWGDPDDPATGNGIDDDGNGFIDDWHGWDFITSNNDIRSPNNFHGTHVSGIISAKLHNGRGISGIGGGNNTNGLQLMMLGVGETAPSSAALDDAILYAIQNGADVIQMSLNVAETAAINNAIQAAIDAGIPVVCASGNSNGAVTYPANNANVISVGSTNQSDQRSSFSNFGPELFISAPGEQIRSTQLGNTYNNSDGTSFAAPQVSAVIGLIRSINPTLTVQQIRSVLQTTAAKVGGVNYNWDANNPGHSQELGFGRLDAEAAIQASMPSVTGPYFVCTSGSLFTLNNIPAGATVSWQATPANFFAINSGTGSSTTLVAVNSKVTGTATLTITLSTCGPNVTISKSLWVGRPANASQYSLTVQGSSSNPVQLAGGSLYQFNMQSVPGTSNYMWQLPSGFSFMTGWPTNQNIAKIWTPTQGGTYQLRCYPQNTCSPLGSTYSSLTIYIQGPGDPPPPCPNPPCQVPQPLSIYPNPASDIVSVLLPGSELEHLELATGSDIRIYNSQSEPVLSMKALGNSISIPVGHLPNGTYFLQIINRDGILQRRLVIKH